MDDSVVTVVNALLDGPPPLVRDLAARRLVAIRTSEMLRRLRAKVRVGFVKTDSNEARAAVVLERVLRLRLWADSGGPAAADTADARSVPLEALSKRIGTRKRDIEKLRTSLEHYLEELGRSGGSLSSKSPSPRSLSPADCQTIRNLSIRFGSGIPDSEGSARRAEYLFASLVDRAQEKRGGWSALLGDMTKHRMTYEAACFYYSVHSDVADAGTTKDSENDEEHRDFTEADVVK